jgi:hypothetical protein
VAVTWLDREPVVLTRDGDFVCAEFRSRVVPERLRLTGARLFPVHGRPELLWSVLHTDHAGILVLRSPDGGNRWEPLLQTDAANAVSLSVTVDRSGGETALLAVGNRVYRLLASPEPVWEGDDAIAISAIAVSPEKGVLLATSHGLLAASHDFATSELVAGSPAPLLDVEIERTGDAIVVERGGSIWRLGRSLAARSGRPFDGESPSAATLSADSETNRDV